MNVMENIELINKLSRLESRELIGVLESLDKFIRMKNLPEDSMNEKSRSKFTYNHQLGVLMITEVFVGEKN